MDPKQNAARAALAHVRSGMTLGLGTGSTAKWFIEFLAAELKAGRLSGIRGVPTSTQSDDQATSLGIPLVDFSQVEQCDLTVDGADEVAPSLTLIKGLGGALLREKIVAQNSKRLIIIADESKVVQQLGSKSPLPVEIAPFARPTSERFLRSLGCTPTLRKRATGQDYVTDNGNLIFDCRFDAIDDAAKLDRDLRSHAGIVETGLFVGIAELAIVGTVDGYRALRR
ncbi:MAG TPA: ribose-5-phosphate isomerase RpiA [Tepidisphaeraceae bacterium]|jgi:ribose 5-phosphate isomerase A